MDQVEQIRRAYFIDGKAIRQDLETLAEVEVREGDQWYLLRSPLQGVAGKVLQAAGVAIPPPLRPMENVAPRP